MFPGQPLTTPAHLPDDEHFRALAELARERTGFDIPSFSWIAEPATENVKLQVLGVAQSLYRARLLCEQGIMPHIIAEHSLGIYPALAVAGSITEGDALELAGKAGRLMAAMGAREFALGCIIGLSAETVLSIAEGSGVFLANCNTSRHFLLSGTRAAMKMAETAARAQGAFSVALFQCDAPLHTPLMAEMEDHFYSLFSCYDYREPSVPVMNHLDNNFLTAAGTSAFLVRQLMEPVYWERTYLALRHAGASSFFETGQGESLKKYNRWIDSEREKEDA